MEATFARLTDAYGTDSFEGLMDEIFPTLDKISVDYGIAEKAGKVAVIPADIGWNDVGSWQRLAEVLAEAGHETENIVVGHHVGVDTTGSLIYSPKRLIATIGLDDIIVIDTPDATLICPKSRSEDVKKIVDALKAQGVTICSKFCVFSSLFLSKTYRTLAKQVFGMLYSFLFPASRGASAWVGSSMVEHLTFNEVVPGSSPGRPTSSLLSCFPLHSAQSGLTCRTA